VKIFVHISFKNKTKKVEFHFYHYKFQVSTKCIQKMALGTHGFGLFSNKEAVLTSQPHPAGLQNHRGKPQQQIHRHLIDYHCMHSLYLAQDTWQNRLKYTYIYNMLIQLFSFCSLYPISYSRLSATAEKDGIIKYVFFFLPSRTVCTLVHLY
jgi:hypothetical protein